MSAKELYIIIQINLNFLIYVMPSIFYYVRFYFVFLFLLLRPLLLRSVSDVYTTLFIY